MSPFVLSGHPGSEIAHWLFAKRATVSRAQRMADDGPRTDADEAPALHDTEIRRSCLTEGVMGVVQRSHAVHGLRVPIKVVRSLVAIVDGVPAAGSVFILSVSSGIYPILTRTESPRESFTGPLHMSLGVGNSCS
jgi:hypothetical protein